MKNKKTKRMRMGSNMIKKKLYHCKICKKLATRFVCLEPYCKKHGDKIMSEVIKNNNWKSRNPEKNRESKKAYYKRNKEEISRKAKLKRDRIREESGKLPRTAMSPEDRKKRQIECGKLYRSRNRKEISKKHKIRYEKKIIDSGRKLRVTYTIEERKIRAYESNKRYRETHREKLSKKAKEKRKQKKESNTSLTRSEGIEI